MSEKKGNYECPHCKQRLTAWEVPQTPFSSFEDDDIYICFNNECQYYTRSWDTMDKQGVTGFSYRLLYIPVRNAYQPIPIPFINESKGNVEEQIESITRIGEAMGRQYG